MPLSTPEGVDADKLKLNDVIYVRVTEGKNQQRRQGRAAGAPQGAGRRGRAGEQDRPHPGHGRRLLLSGRASSTAPRRRCASPAHRSSRSIYLAALHRGLQPNTLVLDSGVTLPPIPGVSTHSLVAEELRRRRLRA